VKLFVFGRRWSKASSNPDYELFLVYAKRIVVCLLQQLAFMQTSHQFLLLSSPPAKEVAFVAARNQHGSTFAFQ